MRRGWVICTIFGCVCVYMVSIAGERGRMWRVHVDCVSESLAPLPYLYNTLTPSLTPSLTPLHSLLLHSLLHSPATTNKHRDLSMKQTFIRRNGPVQYACGQRDFAFHTGVFGKGVTHGNSHLRGSEMRMAISRAQTEFYAQTDEWQHVLSERVENLHTESPPIGRFHGVDTEHCMWIHQHFVDSA